MLKVADIVTRHSRLTSLRLRFGQDRAGSFALLKELIMDIVKQHSTSAGGKPVAS